MRSKRSLEGEILIDHRASPGLDALTAHAFGIEPERVKGGEVFEAALITCGHCQATVVINPDRQRARAWCSKCDHYICDECAARLHLTLVCTTVARRIDAIADAVDRGTSPLLLPPL